MLSKASVDESEDSLVSPPKSIALQPGKRKQHRRMSSNRTLSSSRRSSIVSDLTERSEEECLADMTEYDGDSQVIQRPSMKFSVDKALVEEHDDVALPAPPHIIEGAYISDDEDEYQLLHN